MLEFSKLNSPKLVYEAHEIMAKELNACGINLSFSPVCDILTNPENKVIGDRAYGSDSETVEKYISASIRGLQTSKVLACAKHFPGHGDTTKDSHFDLPVIKTSIEVLKSREVVPFAKASKSRVEFMMMGHLLVDSLDDKLPTSLSSSAYNFLRNETKFTKITITDDLEMRAISDRFSLEEASVLAMNAGADMIILRSIESSQKALHAIREGLKKRIIKKEYVLEKLNRVEKCKKEHFAEYNPIYIPKIVDSFNSESSKKILALFQSTNS
jgi:beta-N-acetylhexosaminidase